MAVEKVLASYVVRFTEKRKHKRVQVHNLRTGETLSFETWVAAWVFLEEAQERPPPKKPCSLNRS